MNILETFTGMNLSTWVSLLLLALTLVVISIYFYDLIEGNKVVGGSY